MKNILKHILLLIIIVYCLLVDVLSVANSTFTYQPWKMTDNELLQQLIKDERQLIESDATLMARLLMTEDKRRKPWIMMASIVKNRADMCYRNKCTINEVIHDPRQFSAVGTYYWRKYSKMNYGDNELFNEAYEISLKILLRGVPEKYATTTHAYYPEAMVNAYGYKKSYPAWDSPANRLENRGKESGWVYGTTL